MTTIIFIVFSFSALILAFVMDGGHVPALLAPTAAIIVFGGTIGAVGISFPFKDVKRLPSIIKVVFKSKDSNIMELIDFFKDLSIKTRKNGLLSIESEISSANFDPFIKKGLQMVVDGVEPATIQGILEMDIEMMAERHGRGAAMFDAAGGYAPTMGIIGTVMGLVHVLGNLEDTSKLGGSIAVAFLATLYGISSANLLWLPIGSKLKVINEEEFNEKKLMLEAILLIQMGTNPNTMVEKLKTFLNKKEAAIYESENKGTEA